LQTKNEKLQKDAREAAEGELRELKKNV